MIAPVDSIDMSGVDEPKFIDLDEGRYDPEPAVYFMARTPGAVKSMEYLSTLDLPELLALRERTAFHVESARFMARKPKARNDQPDLFAGMGIDEPAAVPTGSGVRHAPTGGVDANGTHYAGGEFIPASASAAVGSGNNPSTRVDTSTPVDYDTGVGPGGPEPTKKPVESRPMEAKVIYDSGDGYTVSQKNGHLIIRSQGQEKSIPFHESFGSSELIPSMIKQVKSKMVNPKDYRHIGGTIIRKSAADVIDRMVRERKEKAEAEFLADPSRVERARIDDLFRRSERERDNPNDSVGYWRYRNEAMSALAKWHKDYPEQSARESARSQHLRADDLESKAKGALFYDADGSLSQDDQQKRHDDMMAEANKIRDAAGPIDD